jgi:hypothetical protein
MHVRPLVPVVLATLIFAVGGGSSLAARRDEASPPPRLANPTATAKQLVEHFFLLLHRNDATGLRALLSPAFQYQRVDGFAASKAGFLADFPNPDKYTLSRFAATQAGGTLVVRYRARVEGLTTPRLSVFLWNGSRWQLVAHANFGP